MKNKKEFKKAKITYILAVWDGKKKRQPGYSFVDKEYWEGKYNPQAVEVELIEETKEPKEPKEPKNDLNEILG